MQRCLLRILLLLFPLIVQADESFDALMRKGQALNRQGQYNLALDALQSARFAAMTTEQQVQADGALGLLLFQLHHFDKAEKLLQQSVQKEIGDSSQRARWHMVLSDLYFDKQRIELARQHNRTALNLAGDDQLLQIAIQLSGVSLLPENERFGQLHKLSESLKQMEGDNDLSRYRINLASQAGDLNGNSALKLAYENFESARKQTTNPRISAEALDGLAQLYENKFRFEEAERLNQQGILAAQRVNAQDLLLKLQWRQGRLQKQLNHVTEAIAAFQHAVDHIEALRQDIPVEYHNGKSSFRETLEPVYMGLADLLLKQAHFETGGNRQNLLRRARETVELIKQTEMEDFLGGRCEVAGSKGSLLETRDVNTAILYPIVLPERMELLASIGGDLNQFTQKISAEDLQANIKKMESALRNGKADVKKYGKQLYDWLIAPIKPWFTKKNIKTLVIIPDSTWRVIPLSALYDGEHYLVEQFAVATSPGLTLIDSAPLQKQVVKSLLAGMSEPGDVIYNLPETILDGLAGAVSEGASRGLNVLGEKSRALPFREARVIKDTDDPRVEEGFQETQLTQTRQVPPEVLYSDKFTEKAKELLKLPGVEQEINSLRETIPNTLLMNQDFTKEAFRDRLGEDSFSVIHIASHGVFGNSAENSFIMAYDNIINMNDLEGLLRSDKFDLHPVQLLTLSACQTAEGDDRAPLGISGIAIKAKVRSTIGTLWPVSDEAAWKLMTEFYKNLMKPDTSKVQALKDAQISLIKHENLNHPFFWSPFILVGNWQ